MNKNNILLIYILLCIFIISPIMYFLLKNKNIIYSTNLLIGVLFSSISIVLIVFTINSLKNIPLKPPKPPENFRKSRNYAVIGHQIPPSEVVEWTDQIMRNGWDYSPIVLSSHKLILFTIPKVGFTVIKQLARRMMGFSDWQRGDDEIPHNPSVNGLRYLRQFSENEATGMMISNDWTKAVFVRDPHSRVLSAYLDKAVKTDYVKRHCGHQPSSFGEFVKMTCKDPHWAPQRSFIDDKWWPSINFVGHLDTAAADMERLLRRVGAWEQYGATGWGSGAIFESNALKKRATNAAGLRQQYYDEATRSAVSKKYSDDQDFHMKRYKKITESYIPNWFNGSDISLLKNDIKEIDELNGFVLPHAGTAHTGHILSHTLRFVNPKWIKKDTLNIFIAYYPSSEYPNVEGKFHELYVPLKAILKTSVNIWNKQPNKLNIISWNVRDESNPIINENDIDIWIISADFSHFLTFNDSIKKDNHAAKAIELNLLNHNNMSVVDDKRTFNGISNLTSNIIYNWVGRSRSIGNKGVSYLSFLLLDKQNILQKRQNLNNFSGFFVTGYDDELYTRECLGHFGNFKDITVQNMIQNVKNKGEQYSRLIPSRSGIPVTNFTITFLIKTNDTKYIRGYHGIKKGSYYLRTVMLENTFENGDWINNNNNQWIQLNSNTVFDMTNTYNKLDNKARHFNVGDMSDVELYKEITIPSTLF